MFKKILRVLLHPVLLAVIGLILLSLFIWIVGPWLSIKEEFRPLEPEWARWLLIGLFVGIYLLRKTANWWRAKRLNASLLKGLVPVAEKTASPASEEVDALQKIFREEVEKLKHARLGSPDKLRGLSGLLARKRYLYELPWYMFIGAPGSGKTTALINSGLTFPLVKDTGPSAVKGVGGTRNCDWWFSNEAVLLDTAGRYTTQESNKEVDAGAWKGFLDLLKKYRPKRPINGILLTVSVADLLQQSGKQRETHAAALRARLNELQESLGIRFPVYVIVSKCDLLAGFTEYFSEFGRDERAQVWGVTFPYDEHAKAEEIVRRFSPEFAQLEARINDRLIDRLQKETELARRSLLYAFPQQFGAIEEPLGNFLENVFQASRFHESPMLRGVYFTSGTQEGSPIDRIIGGMSRALGLERKMIPPHALSGRSYFLTRLLKEVVFSEENLAGINHKWERRRHLGRMGSYAALGLACMAILSAWALSYHNNANYVEDVEAQLVETQRAVEKLPPDNSSDLVSLLPVLATTKDVAVTPAVVEGRPLGMRFGLYQGNKLQAAAQSAYRTMLREAFLQRLVGRAEQQLRTTPRDNLEFLYEALKAYVMYYDAEHFSKDALKAWVNLDWDQSFGQELSVQQRRALTEHFDTLFERGPLTPSRPMDKELVQALRTRLASLALPERVYSRLKRQGIGSDQHEFKITAAAGPSASLVFRRASGKPLTEGVAGLYTFNGYHKAFIPASQSLAKQLAAEEGWVLGIEASHRAKMDLTSLQAVGDNVRRLYLEDYARIWQQFVADIKVITPGSLPKAIELARTLSAPDSPLPLLMKAIERETTLGSKQDNEKDLVDQASDKATEIRTQLQKLIPGAQKIAVKPPSAKLESIVDDRFEGIRRMVKPVAPGQPTPLDGSLALINELYGFLVNADTVTKGGAAPPKSEIPTKIKAESKRQPEPVQSMMMTLSTSGEAQALSVTRWNISQQMSADIGSDCAQAITGRYPFVRSSARDVLQEDFARIFGPGGQLDDFFKKNLEPYVDTAAKPWTFKQMGDSTMAHSSNLTEFQRAAIIRRVFFSSGDRSAGMRLTFKPMELDASFSQIILDVDGQLVKYRHGPQEPQTIQWPGPGGSTQVRLQVQPLTGGGPPPLEGPWALFRLFDRAEIAASSQPERFTVTFNFDGRKAVFDVTTSSVQNPFRLKELEQFHCPSRL